MPYYKGVLDELIADGHAVTARDVANRVLRLRNQLKKELPERNVARSILMATWNLREFGRNQKCGIRLNESLLCIAEIISHFDLIAIQEVNHNLGDLQRLMKLLGNWWDYIVTDVTPGRSGNEERTAFIFDGRKIQFDHLAGELVLPPQTRPVRQPARSPFICSFRTGWRRISLCTVHIYYGTSKANDKTRVEEIGAIAKLLSERNERRQNSADGEPENVVLLGDFNIFNKTGDQTSDALAKNDFLVPVAMKRLSGSNLGQDKYFDQIAFHDPKNRLRASRAGVFNFTSTIFGDKEAAAYTESMQRSALEQFTKAKDKTKFYKIWRTFQISDHFPLWLELRTDFADAYLATIMRGKAKNGGQKKTKRIVRKLTRSTKTKRRQLIQ
jgi:endonuclease/exonuclease/phosphatase family metal-dependent hydrolase